MLKNPPRFLFQPYPVFCNSVPFSVWLYGEMVSARTKQGFHGSLCLAANLRYWLPASAQPLNLAIDNPAQHSPRLPWVVFVPRRASTNLAAWYSSLPPRWAAIPHPFSALLVAPAYLGVQGGTFDFVGGVFYFCQRRAIAIWWNTHWWRHKTIGLDLAWNRQLHCFLYVQWQLRIWQCRFVHLSWAGGLKSWLESLF